MTFPRDLTAIRRAAPHIGHLEAIVVIGTYRLRKLSAAFNVFVPAALFCAACLAVWRAF